MLDGYARFNAGSDGRSCGSTPRTPNTRASEDPDSAIHRGIDAVRQQVGRWVETYPDLTVEPLEAGGSGDKVFLWVRFSGHGEGSGVPVEMELAHVITIRDGRAARRRVHGPSEALEAAGLSE